MSGETWAVPYPLARSIPAGHRFTSGETNTLLAERTNLEPDDVLITYADTRGRACIHVLAGVRCAGVFGHGGPCGIVARSETGLDFQVTWEPLGAHLAHANDDPKQLRARIAEVERLNAALWVLATCGVCGNPAKSKADRASFLTSGAHVRCLTDEESLA